MANNILTGMVTVLFSSLAYFISSGVLGNWGSYMWIAPFPILLYSLYTNNTSAFIAAFLSYFLGNAIALLYLGSDLPSALSGHYPLITSILGCAIDAMALAIFILITRFTVLRLNSWITIFMFPSLWTAYEYITSLISSSATNSSIANSQIAWSSLIQIASITGIWGITFLLTLIPASIAITWRYRNTDNQSLKTFAVPACLLLLVASWGFWLLKHELYVPSMIVGLATIPQTVEDLKSTDENKISDLLNTYLDATKELADEGASIVLLPEKAITVKPAYLPNIKEKLIKLAKKKNITIIIGLNKSDEQQNVALVIGPDGKTKCEYNKQHMVKFGAEAKYKPGKDICQFFEDDDKVGVAICHDMDFPKLGREYSKEKVGVLFVPALDFVADAWMHARVALLRGIEGGYSVVRNAQWGYMSISDPQGQISQIRKSSPDSPTILLGTVSAGKGNTFYAKTGDWLPWLCMFMIAYILFRAFTVKKS